MAGPVAKFVRKQPVCLIKNAVDKNLPYGRFLSFSQKLDLKNKVPGRRSIRLLMPRLRLQVKDYRITKLATRAAIHSLLREEDEEEPMEFSLLTPRQKAKELGFGFDRLMADSRSGKMPSLFICNRRRFGQGQNWPSELLGRHLLSLQREKERAVSRLFTERELVELLRISERSLRRERAAGELPFILIRGQIRYREPDVWEYLCRRLVRPEPLTARAREA